jgi:hypothetical protein
MASARAVRPLFPILLIAIIAAAQTTYAADTAPASRKVRRLPEVTVLDSSLLTEERPVGPTARPEWTSARRFPTTRVYIQRDPWEAGTAAWWRLRHNRDGTWVSRATGEIELGLPHRMQLDLYEDVRVDGSRRSRHEDFAAELRWALADWGKLPLNPTLYAEYKWVEDGADVFEAKLLLGGQIAAGWHYGINLVWERELGGADRTNEFQVVGGVSRTLLDGRLSLGTEMKYVNESVTGSRSRPEHKFLLGPSVQWRITDRLNLNATSLFGTNRDSQLQEFWFILAYSFGRSGENDYAARTGLRR